MKDVSKLKDGKVLLEHHYKVITFVFGGKVNCKGLAKTYQYEKIEEDIYGHGQRIEKKYSEMLIEPYHFQNGKNYGVSFEGQIVWVEASDILKQVKEFLRGEIEL